MRENARMTVRGRVLLVKRIAEGGWRVATAASAADVSVRTAYKWLARFRSGGEAMLADRRSAPRRTPRATPQTTVATVEALRRQRMTGPAVARVLGLPRSTVGAILRRIGLARLSALEPRPPVQRCERAAPSCIHVTIGHAASDMSTCMSPSMTRHGSLTPRSCHVLARRTRQAFCGGRSPGTPASASTSSAS